MQHEPFHDAAPQQGGDNDAQYTGATSKPVFPVVGLGASAGGLRALQQFFQAMPPDSGMAFVVILHLSPEHESHAAQILQQSTSMPVTQVTAPVRVEPNRVYIIPPTQSLAMEDGQIVLQTPERPRGQQVAIDLFFRTLAETHTTHAACIVLSGTGADGSVGIKRLKETGGLAIAQEPRDAEYDGMPRNAINTGLIDWVLPVHDMPQRLLAWWHNASQIALPPPTDTPVTPERWVAENALRDVLALVRARTGHDFTHYKRATILRRIERRMQVVTVPTLPAYREYLREHGQEASLLLGDLLIGVTNFFRDRAAWDTLERDVVPQLFANKTTGDVIRAWVAGCASGEEAYSVAMLLLEHAARLPHPPAIQVFATDIDDAAIVTARDGSYPESIEADVSPQRLRTFFTKEPGGYRITPAVRERVLFATHNLIKDPPFSKVDLLTCRNLLIYLNRDMQEQVFPLFHFALRANGFLFLGSSESIDGASDLFATVNTKHRVFRALPVNRAGLVVPPLPLETPVVRPRPRADVGAERRRIAFGELHQRMLEHYAPPSIIVDRNFEIVHLSEHAGRFIQLAGGEPTLNLLQVVLPTLRVELRTALLQAFASGKGTEARRVQIERDGRTGYVNMIVRPERDPVTATDWALVLFAEADEIVGTEGKGRDEHAPEPVMRYLENENQSLKAQLQGTIEQYETTLEELKASNEELQAVNEELRSAGEELETSKEELQSVNEELRTVNDELKHKIDEVSAANDDLRNLIASTDIATVFLDRAGRIKRYTPRAVDIFNLLPGDEGRPLADLTRKIAYRELGADADTVLRTLQPVEREVAGHDGHHYVTRVVPYRTTNDRIDGVVLTFVDISHRKRVEEALRTSEERLRLLIESATDYAIFSLDAARRVTSWSTGAKAIFGYTEHEILGQSGDIMFVPEDRERGDPEREAQTARDEGRAGNERWHERKNGTRFYGSGAVRPLRDEAGTLRGFVKIMRDLTEQQRTEEALRASEEKYRTLFTSMDEGYAVVEVLADNNGVWNDFLFVDVNPAFVKQTGMAYPVGRRATELLDTPDPHWAKIYGQVADTGEPVRFEQHEATLGRVFDLYCFRLNNDGSRRVAVLFTDITERKRHERAQEFLLTLSDALRPLSDPVDIQATASRVLGEHLGTDRAYYVEFDYAHNVYVVVRDWHKVGAPSHARRYPLDDWSMPWLIDGKTWVVRDVDVDPALRDDQRAAYRGNDIGAAVVVPLRKADRLVATFVTNQRAPRPWTPDEVALVEETAERTWAAVERARAEAALRASEERLQKAISIETVGVLFFDADGTLTDANDAFLRMSGFAREQIDARQLNTKDMTLPEWMPPTQQHLEELQATGRTKPYEKELRRSDGTHWWGLFAPTLLSGEGRDSECVEFIIDITARKQAETARRESEARLRTLIENLPGSAAFIVDHNLRYLVAEGEALAAAGFTPKDLVGRTLRETMPPELVAQYEPMYRRALAGEAFEHEHNAHHRSFISRGVPLRGASGDVYAVLAVSYDITERKQVEEALRESEARARTLIRNLPGGAAFIFDRDLRYVLADGEALYAVGRTPADYEGKTVDEVLPPELVGELKAALNDALGGEAFELERAQGPRTFVSRGVPLHDTGGDVAGVLVVSYDITARKQAEDEVTRALQAEQAARAEAESALRIRDQFLSIASHELRTPLTSLIGYTGMLPRIVRGSTDTEKMTDRIMRQAQRLNTLIDQLLDISRLQQGQFAIERRPVDLASLVAQMVDEVRATLAPTTKHSVEFIRSAEPVMVNGDAQRLEQVIANLLSNAIKYSPDGGPVRIHVERTDTEAVVTVTDHGIGIPQDAQARLFEPFYRAPNVGGQASGFGVGLYIVQEIVQRHDGRVTVHSTNNGGSTFAVTLPLNDER